MKKLNTVKYIYLLAALSLIALLIPLFANDVPIILRTNEGFELPFLKRSTYIPVQDDKILWQIKPLINRHANTLRPRDSFVAPINDGYFLGTDGIGRDVFLGILYGLRVSLVISLLSAFIAGFGAIVFGSLSGYFGDSKLNISPYELMVYFIIFSLGLYISIVWLNLRVSIFYLLIFWFAIISCFMGIHLLLARWQIIQNRVFGIPIDSIVMRIVEIFESIPGLFILIALLGYIERVSLLSMSVIIGVLLMPRLTRFVRGEIFNIKSEDFIRTAQVLNFSHSNILFRQILPNIFGPIAVALSFSAAGAILIESTLSFLGIGLSAETVSWGGLLTESRKNINAWWLAIFPGMAIYLLIIFYYALGRSISKKYHPKSITF